MARIHPRFSSSLRPWVLAAAALASSAWGCGAAPGAGSAPGPSKGHRSYWEVNRVTWVRLVPREKDSLQNQHPARLDPGAVQRQLEEVRLVAEGAEEPLFAKDELAALVGPICEALGVADPEEDLVLLSSHRRGAGLMAPQLGLTARLFLQGGSLNLIVHETRLEFVGRYLMDNDKPNFQFGTRKAPGPAVLRCASAQPSRRDWLAFPAPLAGQPAGLPPPAAPSPSLEKKVSAPAAPPAVAPPSSYPKEGKVRDAAFLEEQEARLRALKRMREGNLITEEEYQRKRREILDGI
jgi:hypothetical protein